MTSHSSAASIRIVLTTATSLCADTTVPSSAACSIASPARPAFPSEKGTPLFDSHLAEDKVLALLTHIAEDCDVRKTSRLVGVSKDTVSSYIRLAGQHARKLHDELVAFPPSDPRGPV